MEVDASEALKVCHVTRLTVSPLDSFFTQLLLRSEMFSIWSPCVQLGLLYLQAENYTAHSCAYSTDLRRTRKPRTYKVIKGSDQRRYEREGKEQSKWNQPFYYLIDGVAYLPNDVCKLKRTSHCGIKIPPGDWMLILEVNAICLQYPLEEVVEALDTPLDHFW